MDLTSGAPFWIIKNGLLATYPRLKRDRRCDVAVMGGGITGALVADGDDCGYRRKKSLYLASKARDQRTLEEEYMRRHDTWIRRS